MILSIYCNQGIHISLGKDFVYVKILSKFYIIKRKQIMSFHNLFYTRITHISCEKKFCL